VEPASGLLLIANAITFRVVLAHRCGSSL